MSNETLTWTPCPRGFRSQVVEHGLKDSKNRTLGHFAVLEERPDSEIDPENPTWPGGCPRYRMNGKTYWDVSTRATRDGAHFGALTRGTRVETLEEAKALAEKKMAEAARRTAKQVAKGVGRQYQKPAV